MLPALVETEKQASLWKHTMEVLYEDDPENESYWRSRQFWPKFLQDLNYDHAYLLDKFKTIAGDCNFRYFILMQYIDKENFTSNYYSEQTSYKDRLQDIKLTWKRALRTKVKAFITWEYPTIRDEQDHEETHFCMIIADPRSKSAISIDSRGTTFVNSFSLKWRDNFLQLKAIFKDMHWIDAITSDLQGLNVNDSFCQTWSLLLTVRVLQGRVVTADSFSLKMNGYSELINFWRELCCLSEVREALYYEVYCETHGAGDRTYDRYFSTLEALVTGSFSTYYPCADKVSYFQSGYTFIEDFLRALTPEIMNAVLQ